MVVLPQIFTFSLNQQGTSCIRLNSVKPRVTFVTRGHAATSTKLRKSVGNTALCSAQLHCYTVYDLSSEAPRPKAVASQKEYCFFMAFISD